MAIPPSQWPTRLFDQNFGMCITPHDYLFPFYNNYSNYYYRPWKLCTQNVAKDFGSTISNEQELFRVTLDVQHFLPNELSVKVADNQIIVEGTHGERKDEHGFVSRQFTRRYALPSNCIPEDVISNLSSDGVLTVIANKSKERPNNEQIVPITLCKSCPLKGDAIKTVINADQMDKPAESKNVDFKKTNKHIMLKEDHCCLLLKPELLREAAVESEIMGEKKREKLEKDKMKAYQAGKNTSEMLEQTFAEASAIGLVSDEKFAKTDKSAMSKSETMEQRMDKSRATSSTCGEKTSAAMSTCGEKLEQTFAKSSESMLASEEKFDLFDKSDILEQTFEKSNTTMSEKATEYSGISKAEMSEKAAEYSGISIAEMSEVSSTSSKTSTCVESSTSYKASVKSNIKEMSEELSDFVCDILSSELDETLDIKK